ncbi:Flp pilus assembly protein CpaB [Bosea sp. F3-2]|uniref:Flp pilus assembly protein CpaB n=1 Tax=Bosea sp. F3-2 TaxID=2599640 RepID=UPI0011EC0937|nr:Flp pilus assembly protein CpaB [Bosea sp. F3-2]QEL24300.1 Flp pilus assembly protein CpaB [Bosea sp. F3-2]
MSPARIIILVVALAAGLGAALLVQQPSQAPAPAAKVEQAPTVPVLVAASDIPVGNTVTANDLRWLTWPIGGVPGGVIRKDEAPEAEKEIIGQVARYAILGAEPIRREKLIRTDGTGFLSAVLPSGMRAVAISTDSRGANTAGGFILPNDRVDVVSTTRGDPDGGNQSYASETILRNIRVLAIGQNVQERNGEKVVVGETATLEVDPGQVAILAQAQKSGTLSLALRSLKDANEPAPPSSADSALTLVRYGVITKSVKP